MRTGWSFGTRQGDYIHTHPCSYTQFRKLGISLSKLGRFGPYVENRFICHIPWSGIFH